ncbi:MAG TPA: hypothetical protein DCE74_12555, partial [Porphyromonadaceae bacterium]|nr:hypothetical protein [Porphyromonadaceae bacterium]
ARNIGIEFIVSTVNTTTLNRQGMKEIVITDLATITTVITATIAVNTIETMTATATTTAIKVGITKEKETMAMAKISLEKGIITEDGNLTPLL